jgi:hypothetical protein
MSGNALAIAENSLTDMSVAPNRNVEKGNAQQPDNGGTGEHGCDGTVVAH